MSGFNEDFNMGTEKESRQKRFEQKNRNRKRWEKKANGMYWIGNKAKERFIRLASNHGKLCSCYMCGNPRRHHKEKTIQELRFEQEDYEGI